MVSAVPHANAHDENANTGYDGIDAKAESDIEFCSHHSTFRARQEEDMMLACYFMLFKSLSFEPQGPGPNFPRASWNI